MTPSDPYPAVPGPTQQGSHGGNGQPGANAPYGGWYPQGYYYPAYGAQSYYYPPNYFQQPQPPRDTYRLAMGIIVTIALGLLLLGGLFGLLITLASFSISSSAANDLPAWALILPAEILAIAGGGVGLFLTIRALMGRSSAPMRLPSYWWVLGLTAVALGAAIVLFNIGPQPNSALAVTPLLFTCVALPSVTILAFTSQRLGNPSTWRHVWLSILNGFFLAALLAIILEAVLGTAAALILRSNLSTALQSPGSGDVILVLVIGSLIAPLVEESVKPIGALVILGRLRGPAETFLVGLAGGLGFAVFESLGYVSIGNADWPAIAIERIGTGLLHGTGAGMTALGCYYLFRGAGIAHRYWKGFGAIAYAILQHSLWNGIQVLLSVVPGALGNSIHTPIFLFGLPLLSGDAIVLVLYAAQVTALVIITKRLRSAPQRSETMANTTAPPMQSLVVPEGVVAR